MKIGYVRVSTVEQNEARQVEALQKHGVEEWYIEKVSGKDMDRPKLQEMLHFVRRGDTIYIHDLSRISRSLPDLLKLIDTLNKREVELVSDHESIDTSTPTGKLLLTMIGAINEFERENMLERQREGIAIAKREGKYKGRKGTKLADIAGAYDAWMRRETTKAEIARVNGISRPTLDKLFAAYEKEQLEEPSTG